MPTTASLSPVSPHGPGAGSSRAAGYDTWTDWVDSGDWHETMTTLALPANASDIMVLALDPDVSVTQLVHVVSRDQVLAARILRLANSARCADSEEITTINSAVVRIGTVSVGNVVLATCMASRLQKQGAYGLRGRDLADHGIGAALMGQVVAKLAGANPEEAFLYGLLHDLGKLLVLQLAMEYESATGRRPRPAELVEVMDRCHAELGGKLLAAWRLPTVIQQPVVFHHHPDACRQHPHEAAVAYVADRLSHRYGFGCRSDSSTDLLSDPVAARLGITASWLADLDQRAPALMQSVAFFAD